MTRRKPKHATREEWLTAAAAAIRPIFDEAEIAPYPKLRFSCGFPKARGGKRFIGQCFSATVSKDKTFEVFVSPELDDPYEVIDTLTHELVHAVDHCKNGHRAPFTAICRAIGLTKGKPKQAGADADLEKQLRKILRTLGAYPHAKITRRKVVKQGTRMLKIACPKCGYTVRTTRKWIDHGLPTCPCGKKMRRAD